MASIKYLTICIISSVTDKRTKFYERSMISPVLYCTKGQDGDALDVVTDVGCFFFWGKNIVIRILIYYIYALRGFRLKVLTI